LGATEGGFDGSSVEATAADCLFHGVAEPLEGPIPGKTDTGFALMSAEVGLRGGALDTEVPIDVGADGAIGALGAAGCPNDEGVEGVLRCAGGGGGGGGAATGFGLGGISSK